MSMTRTGLLAAFALTMALASCMSSDRPSSPTGGSGGSDDTGGSTGTGGSTSTGGSTATGGSPGTGGSTSTGGTTGTGGSTSTGGSSGTPDAGSSGGSDASASAWPGCLEPVFSGVTPADFCKVYATVCTFTGTNHYTSMADCMTKFHGMSNDGDACKSGHLCRATMDATMKTADCASSGTAKCSN
jgi:hypothetical protein